MPSDTLTSCGVSCTQCAASGTLTSFDRPTCTAGTCGTACITSCNSMCVDVNTDEANCGACGTTCPGGQTCSEGTCRASCTTGVAFANVLPYQTLINVGSTYRFVMEDVNNDGRVDLIDNGNTGMQVRLAQADGTFGAVQSWAMTTRPIAIAAIDLDGDTFKELVGLRNSTSTQVFVVRNTAGVLATTGTSYSLSGTASAFTFFDANGDGRLDIVVGTSTNGAILQQSAVTPATFGTSTAFTQPFASPTIIETAQLDADGRADMVYANTFQYRVARQTATFALFTLGTAVSQAIVSLQARDLNGNGTQDLLIRSGTNALVLAQGNGDGTFVSSSATFPGSAGVIAADLNNDSNLDLIGGSTSLVYVAIATAPATWSASPPNYLVNSPGGSQNLLAVGQLIGDARPEIFSAGVVGTTNTLSALVNDGTGQFNGARASGVSGGPFASIAAGDFDGDGDRDVVMLPAISTGGSGNASVLLGSNDGSFGASVATLALRGDEYAVGRVNADAMDDLAVIIESAVGAGVEVRLATGGGVFAAPVTLATSATPVRVVIANVNGDTFTDLVIATTSGVEWAPGNGDGTFQTVRTIATLTSVQAIAVVDMNMDSRPDVVVNAASTLRVFGNLGMGTFTTAAIGSATTNTAVNDIVPGDLDQDGRPDLVLGGPAIVLTLRGSGNGGVTAVNSSITVSGRVKVADLDNDGLLDLIVITTVGDFHTFKGLPNFSFAPRATWAPGRQLSTTALVVDRINTDTFRDIVVFNPSGEAWSYLGVCR